MPTRFQWASNSLRRIMSYKIRKSAELFSPNWQRRFAEPRRHEYNQTLKQRSVYMRSVFYSFSHGSIMRNSSLPFQDGRSPQISSVINGMKGWSTYGLLTPNRSTHK